jgi:hypothetical protein
MLELAIGGATFRLSTELPVSRSRWQLALTYNAAASIKVAMTAATTERTLNDLDGTRQLYTALAIAAAVPKLNVEFSHCLTIKKARAVAGWDFVVGRRSESVAPHRGAFFQCRVLRVVKCIALAKGFLNLS